MDAPEVEPKEETDAEEDTVAEDAEDEGKEEAPAGEEVSAKTNDTDKRRISCGRDSFGGRSIRRGDAKRRRPRKR